ncbi:MAG: hypothetical protein CVT49_10735 [candidate division Zixibacteria bacterium HGW-Zixibacteria-1]|nr:MAG: hypothetical protein CVT49_10735 [candidate division Zixibacteria bacterium HGW-Zixibacteria-1]
MKYSHIRIPVYIAGLLLSAIAMSLISACSSDSGDMQNQNFGLIPLKKDCFGKVVKFSTPESFIFDETSNCYFISNINGDPFGKDDNGYIIKLDSNFRLIDNYFIDGRSEQVQLNAPKGMAVFDSILYVADIGNVRAFEVSSGRQLSGIDFSPFRPKFLNDMAVDAIGRLYVSDMLTDRIFMVDTTGEITEIAVLESPNGLLWDKGGFLYAACWSPPRIAKIAFSETVRDILTDENFGQLDGIDVDRRGSLYFSDHRKGAIYKFDPVNARLDTVLTNMGLPADISIDRKNNLLLIPDFRGSCCVYKLN